MAHDHDHENDHGHDHSSSGPQAPFSTTTVDVMRAAQGPLKAGYKENAEDALITLKSSGTLDSQSITCSLDSPNASAVRSAHKKVAGLHPKAGGPGAEISGELCSGDMLLEALVACAGVTLKAVASALEVPIESGKVTAEGDLDFRGTLGVDKTAPVGFKAIRLHFQLTMEKGKEVEEEKIEKLGKLTERYCVVLQTIAKKPQLSVRVDGLTEPEEGVEKGVSWAERMP